VFSLAAERPLSLSFFFSACLHLITLQYLTLFFICSAEMEKKTRISSSVGESEIQKCLSIYFIPN
jgi:hypothetical protein